MKCIYIGRCKKTFFETHVLLRHSLLRRKEKIPSRAKGTDKLLTIDTKNQLKIPNHVLLDMLNILMGDMYAVVP